MGHEAAAAVKAIRANLVADSTLLALVSTKIFAESAPQDAVLPYVVLRQRSPGDDSKPVNPGKRSMTSPLYDIGIYVADDPFSATAQSGAKRIDVALEGLGHYSVTDLNSDTWQVSIQSEGGAWTREEIDLKGGGQKFYWVGRSYRLSISAA